VDQTSLGRAVVSLKQAAQWAAGAGVRLALDGGGAVAARWVLGCDGLHSTVRRLAGLGAGSDGRRYAVRRHAAVAPWSSRVEVHWGPSVEAYVTPVGPGEVGVAVQGPRGSGLAEALAELPALRDRLAGADWTTAPRGAGPLRQRVRARTSGRVLLAGDAAGYVDALTGEGLRVGMASARAAVQAVGAALRAGPGNGGPGRPAALAGYERR
jgi:flavin-dependent dehydrogenase